VLIQATTLAAFAEEVLICESSSENWFLLYALNLWRTSNNGSSDSGGEIKSALDFSNVQAIDNAAKGAGNLGQAGNDHGTWPVVDTRAAVFDIFGVVGSNGLVDISLRGILGVEEIEEDVEYGVLFTWAEDFVGASWQFRSLSCWWWWSLCGCSRCNEQDETGKVGVHHFEN